MLKWSAIFLIVAIIAALLGFGGVAGAAVAISKFLFFTFLCIAVFLFFTAVCLGDGKDWD